MPEGYTHLRCAWRAARAQKLTADLHREAFFAGANGPDMLFCYQVWKPAKKRAYPLPDLGGLPGDTEILRRGGSTGPFGLSEGSGTGGAAESGRNL